MVLAWSKWGELISSRETHMTKIIVRAGDFTFDARFEEQLSPKTVAASRKAATAVAATSEHI